MQARRAYDSQARLPRMVGSCSFVNRPAEGGRAFFCRCTRWFLSNFYRKDVGRRRTTMSYSET